MKDAELFQKICNSSYTNIGRDLSYHIEIDDVEHTIRVMFQGTVSKTDCVSDLLIFVVPAVINGSIYWTTYGWWRAFCSGKAEILLNTLKAYRDNPRYRIEVSGHSLGGLMAVLFGITLYKEVGIRSRLVTFGAPKGLFGRLTVYKAKACFTSITQYAHWSDIVTWCVPFLGYHTIKNTHLGKFSIPGLFNPNKYHMIYGDETLYAEN